MPLTSIVDFVASQVLTAAQMDDVNCGVKSFATTATRDAAYGGSGERTLAEGETCYIEGEDRSMIYDGSVWNNAVMIGAARGYTPTLASAGAGTDWALGNGTITGQYVQLGRLTVGRFRIVFGSTTTFGTKALLVTAPTTMDTLDIFMRGQALMVDTSASARYDGVVGMDADRFAMVARESSGTYGRFSDVTSTIPFTWANTDTIHVQFIYQNNSSNP